MPYSVMVETDDKHLDVNEMIESYQVLEKTYKIYIPVEPQEVTFTAISQRDMRYIPVNGDFNGIKVMPSQNPEKHNLFIGLKG